MATKSRPKQHTKKKLEASATPFPLKEEVRTYEAHLPRWTDREGQFVLIKGREVLGIYLRREDALAEAYDRLGSGPFLVKQILVHEPIYQLGRVEL